MSAETKSFFQRTAAYFDRIAKGLFGVTYGGPGAETWNQATLFNTGQPLGTPDDLKTYAYKLHADTCIALSAISGDASSVDWELFAVKGEKKPTDKPVEEHPVFAVWNRPNRYMYGKQLWIGSYLSKLIFGEYFWYYPDLSLPKKGESAQLTALRGQDSIVDKILLLDPRCVVNREDKSTGQMRWYWSVGGVEKELDATKLTHSKRWNPYDYWRGLSKMEAVLSEIAGDYAAAEWNKRFFTNQNGLVAGILIPAQGQNLTHDQRQEVGRLWNQQHTGWKRTVGVLPGGWSFQEMGLSQKDMDFKALREYSREKVLGVWGVPPFIAGVLDKANYANAREQKEVYWQGTIWRFLTEEQEVLNNDFFPKVGIKEKAYPKWEVVRALLEDMEAKANLVAKFWAVGVPFAALNDRFELGFDTTKIEGADKGFVPNTVKPMEFALEPPAPPVAPIAPGQPAEDGEGGEPGDEPKPPPKQLVSKRPVGEERRKLYWRSIWNQVRDIEAQFERVIRRHFNEIEAEVLGEVQGLKGWQMRIRAAKGPTEDSIANLFDLAAAKKRLVKVTNPLHRAAIKRGGDTVLASLGFEHGLTEISPYTVAKLSQLSFKIQQVDVTLEKELRAQLIEGLNAGESVTQLAGRVKDQMRTSMKRARVIARTETGMGFNAGRMAGMQEAGVERIEWLSSRDDKVRDTHAEEDGNVTHVGEPFEVTGLLYPLDPSGPPEEIVQCRCTVLPVLGEGAVG